MKNWFVFVFFGLIFFINIQYNFFYLIPKDKFESSKSEVSETLVIGKLVNSENGSIFDDGGFTGTYRFEKNNDSKSKAGWKLYKRFLKNDIPPKYQYEPYKSQIGGQAILYSVVDKAFNLDNEFAITFFRIFNSLMLSIVLTLFMVWIKNKYRLVTSLICFLLILPNYWIFIYGKSAWWCIWVYFLPFVYGLFFFEGKASKNLAKYGVVMSFLFFTKFWFTGFEFITTFLVTSSIPYILYLYKNEFGFYLKFLKLHFFITIVPILLALLFQLYQFKILTGSFGNGIIHLIDSYKRRSNGNYTYDGELAYLNNYKKFGLDIIVRYLGNSFINEDFLMKFPFILLIVVGLISSLVLLRNNIEKKLVYTTWFSILAPFSWFFIFKEHAHIHKHIDFFVWYSPFLVLLMLTIALAINFYLKKIRL